VRNPGWKWVLAAVLVMLGTAAFALLLRFPRVTSCSYMTPRPTVACPQPSHWVERFAVFGVGVLGAVGVLAIGVSVTGNRGDL
jgi:hypothetical protein